MSSLWTVWDLPQKSNWLCRWVVPCALCDLMFDASNLFSGSVSTLAINSCQDNLTPCFLHRKTLIFFNLYRKSCPHPRKEFGRGLEFSAPQTYSGFCWENVETKGLFRLFCPQLHKNIEYSFVFLF